MWLMMVVAPGVCRAARVSRCLPVVWVGNFAPLVLCGVLWGGIRWWCDWSRLPCAVLHPFAIWFLLAWMIEPALRMSLDECTMGMNSPK